MGLSVLMVISLVVNLFLCLCPYGGVPVVQLNCVLPRIIVVLHESFVYEFFTDQGMKRDKCL